MATAQTFPGAFSGLYYRHSGKFSHSGVLAGVAAGIGAGLTLAVAYAYLLHWVSLVVLRFLLPMGFAAGFGVVIGLVMRATKVRNLPVAMFAGVLVAAIGLYVSWGVWFYRLLQLDGVEIGLQGIVALLLKPDAMWAMIRELAGQYSWTVTDHGRESSVGGWQVSLLWSAEALAVVTFALLAVRHQILRDPFCEQCNNWCTPTNGVLWIVPDDVAEVRRQLEAKNLGYIESHRAELGTMQGYRLDLHSCASCGNSHTLTARWVAAKSNGRNEEKVVTDKLLVSAAEAEKIRALGTAQTGTS